MIDFRYHLVSIVSIFLALAVGIVLGSGPLKDTLSNQLTDEVTSLRASKATLNSRLGAASKGNESRDAFTEALAPALIGGKLSGKTVALVVVPGADAATIKATTTALATAGAKIGSTVTLTDAWADPTKQDFRTTLITQLATGAKIATSVAPELLPGTLLAKGILGNPNRAGAASTQALDGLKAGGLLSYSPATVTLSSSVIVVGAPLTTPAGASDVDAAAAKARTAAYVDMSRALDSGGSGAVVVEQSDSADPTTPEGLVAAVRSDASSSKAVGTVDDANLPMGQVATVLALREQYDGGSGAYGLANDASAPVPDLTGA